MPLQFPSYAKTACVLLSLSIIILLLYVGQHILFPIMLSLLVSILLVPVVHFFTDKLRFPHVIAVLTSVILFVLFILAIIFFVSWQISSIADDWNKIKENIGIHYQHLREWISQQLRISYGIQDKYIKQAKEGSLNGNKQILGETLSSFTGILLNIVLIPIYTFLLLLYRKLFIKFLYKLVSQDQFGNLKTILTEIKMVIRSYLLGIILELVIVSTLTTVGLMIIGVQYALLLGIITGLLNMIPYIGIMFAAFIAIISTLTTSTDLSVIAGIVIVNALVQLIDNNLLIPLVVSSKVKINALLSIIGIIIGGAIAGVAGMFLAIPVIAILKVIFDHTESFKPLGFVMGDDDAPRTHNWRRKLKFHFWHAGHKNKKNS